MGVGTVASRNLVNTFVVNKSTFDFGSRRFRGLLANSTNEFLRRGTRGHTLIARVSYLASGSPCTSCSGGSGVVGGATARRSFEESKSTVRLWFVTASGLVVFADGGGCWGDTVLLPHTLSFSIGHTARG